MIAIVFALPEESSDLRRLVRDQVARGRGATLEVRGRLGEHAVVIAHTGMGAAAAGERMPCILRDWSPSLVIGSGFAGGLQSHLRTGDVVCDLRGVSSLPPLEEFALHGRIAASKRALETAEAKAAFGRETGALAVDMESAAGARVCAEAGVPFIGLRAISDPVTAPLPVPMEHWFDLERQRPRPAALLLFLARNPGRILPFVRFVRGLAMPRAALSRSLAGIFAKLPSAPGAPH